jgi:DNA-binding response OmpR family regulator
MAKKILLVDDDQNTLDLLEVFLYRDYEIITALNGFEALTRAEKEQPDLIMTDITMPEMDGIRFFNRIGKSKCGAPIIAVTSFGEDSTRNSLLNMGFFGVVCKPFEKKDIAEVVAKAISRADGKHAEKGKEERD